MTLYLLMSARLGEYSWKSLNLTGSWDYFFLASVLKVINKPLWMYSSHYCICQCSPDGVICVPELILFKANSCKSFLWLGESGLGKSTLINSLFLTDLYPERHIPSAAGTYVGHSKHTLYFSPIPIPLFPPYLSFLLISTSFSLSVLYFPHRFCVYFPISFHILNFPSQP